MTSKFEGLVESLKNKNSTGTPEIYTQLISKIKKNRKGFIQLSSDIITCVRRDLVIKDNESADAAFIFLSHFYDLAASQLAGKDDVLKPMFIEALVSTATVDCIRKYFPVVFSSLPKKEFVTLSYETICQDKKNLSFVVKDEMLKLISKILVDTENATPDFLAFYPRILQIMLVFTTDNEGLLRKQAIQTAADFIQAHPTQPTEISQIINCMKNLIGPKLNSLLKKNAEYLQEFLNDQLPLYLKIVGINMRKSSSLTNTFLKIIEQGFRDTSVDVKAASFKTWEVLINELSVDLEVLSSSRYMNLVMQPLTTVQSSESLNVLRIRTLWGLAKKLKNKLPALFPTVCLPILHCCLGNLDGSKRLSDVRGSSLKTNRKSSFYTAMQATGYRATPNKASKSSKLHKIGVHVLMHLLAYSEEEDIFETSKPTLTELDTKFLATPATFNSYGLIFIAAVEEILCNKVRISPELAMELWNRLHHHSKALLELNLQKNKREPEMFNTLIVAFTNILTASSLSSDVTFAMLKSFLEFPDSILSSTFYGGASNGVHGFPALTLLQLLFSGNLALEQSSQRPFELLTCACDLVTLGFNSIIGILPYCCSVLEILVSFMLKSSIGTNEEDCAVDQCVDVIFKLWVKIGAGLKGHIEKTQEVNQGDNLDHDFTTLYFFLLFPAHVKTFKTDCIDTWDFVYDEFFKGSSFVRTCKANEICSYLSSKLLKLVDSNWSNSALEFVGHICNTMANKAQYNHGGFSKPKFSRHDSKSMSPKRQPAPELVLEIHENLAELCLLVKKLFVILSEKPNTRLCDANMECLAHLFSSIYYSEDIKILFRTFVPALRNVVANNHENVKIFCERMQTIFHAVESVYRSCVMENNMAVFQEDFHLLICECIQNSNSKIRNIAVELWQNVVVDSQQHTVICDSMASEIKSHLFPVYKIMGWSCPWKDVELPATLELPDCSGDTQSSDMVTVGYGAFGSPTKGNRFASPRKTPQRAVSSPLKAVATPPTVKRKLDTATDNVNYVNCVSPFTKPRTPLTERQKEKLREREFIPTMYNELDDKQEADIEIDTQENFDSNNRPDNAAIGSDIIESSQSQESPKKKMKFDMGNKDIPSLIVSSRNSGDELDDTRTLNCSMAEIQQCHDESRVSDSGYTDNEGLTTGTGMSSIFESAEADNIRDDEKNVANLTSTSNQSFEYVEMNDASTNETHHDRDITLDNEDKDLGVTPLDESYEYVVMADMSINASNFTNASMHASLHSGEVSSDKENAQSKLVRKSVDCISVRLDHIKEDHNATGSTGKKKSKRGRPKRKDKMKADYTVDDDSTSFHDNSNAGSQDSYSSASSQGNVKGQRNHTTPTNKKKAGKTSKMQPEKEYDTANENDSEKPVLRRSQRSKTRTSKCQQSEDKTAAPSVIDTHAEAVPHGGSKTQDVCMNDVDYELSTSNTETKIGSSEECVDVNDTTMYEYVEVADTSCFNVSQQSNLASHDDSTISNASSNHKQESENVSKTDLSTTTSKPEGVCDTTSVGSDFESTGVTVPAGSICDTNSTFVIEPEVPIDIVTAPTTNSTFITEPEVSSDVVAGSNRSISDTNSTFVVESAVTEDNVPVSDRSIESINSTHTVETNSDEDDFLDARSSLGMCQSINTVASSTVNQSNACIEDDPDFMEKNISAISIEVSKDKMTVDDLSEQHASGDKVSDKNTDNTSVPYETANLNLESGHLAVSKIASVRAANMESLTDEYQTSPVSSKQKNFVTMEIGDSNTLSTDSPSAKGILKRRSMVTDSSPAASPSNKRVSFADPVSVTGITSGSNCENNDFLQSPRSVRYRTKNVPKVNRRLSLQAERMRYPHENKVAVSPLSLRSVRVAEAIANIRGKDSNSSRLLFNRTNNDDVIDFGKVSISDLQSQEFLRSLDREQGLQLFRILNSIELDLVTNVLGT